MTTLLREGCAPWGKEPGELQLWLVKGSSGVFSVHYRKPKEEWSMDSDGRKLYDFAGYIGFSLQLEEAVKVFGAGILDMPVRSARRLKDLAFADDEMFVLEWVDLEEKED